MENERKDIRELAKKYQRLQTLMHYVNKETLIKEHNKQISGKASGVDKVTKEEYEINLNNKIDNLLERMKLFNYLPQPVRRTFIPKPGSDKLRPLGIPAYEDKLVQGAMAYVLNEIYETKFLDCSYGFRPDRNCHMAIKEINRLIMTKKVNYILDCDIKGFFDNVNHQWLMEFLKHDIEDKNFLRYIVRFLKSGIMEDMKYYESDKGTPQGGLISPILANVYLHYVLDLWFYHVKKQFQGEMYLIRYADDFIVLFQYKEEAEQFYQILLERLAKFGLEISEEKTRILPFGRFKGTDEKFDFLGFTHINGKTRTNKYMVKHITSRKKLKSKKSTVKEWLKENMHTMFDELFKTLNRKLTGHYVYYGISGNYESICKFYKYTKYELYRVLNRRHQKRSMKFTDYLRIWENYISKPKLYVNIW
jgi:RNA-directed DNA polymerase